MRGRNSLLIVLSYGAATVGAVLFFFSFIATNILVESNNTTAYILSVSSFFLIPLIGLIHLAVLLLTWQEIVRILTRSMVVGCVGPLLILASYATSTDPQAAFGLVLIPIAYFAFVLAGFFCLLIAACLKRRHRDPDAILCANCGYDLRGASDASPRICSECGTPQE